MKLRFLRWFIMAALVASGSAAVTQPAASQPLQNGATPHEITVSSESKGANIDLGSGDELVVRLASNPSTGFQWDVQSIDSQALTPLAMDEYEGTPELLGAPVTQVLRFSPRAAGSADLSLVYRRPWETLLAASSESTYTLKVTTHGAASYTYTPVSQPASTPDLPQEADPSQAGHYFSDIFRSLFTNTLASLPTAKNWCAEGDCTPIRDQGQCGSCWAFSVVGVLESAILKTDGVSRDLSEQYLVSCNKKNYNCEKGGSYDAHDYHQYLVPPGELTAGAVDEADFPYKAVDGTCSNQPHQHHERITSWSYVSDNPPSTTQIKQAIMDHGPVAASICAGNNFQNYRGGVFSASETCGGFPNHAIVLVGWDDNKQGGGAWLLRNSWGTYWGDNGYMWINYGTSLVGEWANYVVYNPGSVTPTPPVNYNYHIYVPAVSKPAQ